MTIDGAQTEKHRKYVENTELHDETIIREVNYFRTKLMMMMIVLLKISIITIINITILINII